MSNDFKGPLAMVSAMALFALQDGVSRHLAGEYNVLMVVMIRYWAFAAFVLALASRRRGIRQTARSARPGLQIARGALLALEVCVTILAFTLLGLIETHAIFAIYPLMLTAMAVPILRETVGWRRWSAVGVGFIGVLVILDPGGGVFTPLALIPLTGAAMFALYGVLTRLAAQTDTAETSFFWTGIAGAVVMTAIGIWDWQPLIAADWIWMAALCVSAIIGHWLLIKAYDLSEASRIQPLAYTQLAFITLLGLLVFDEELRAPVIWGTALIVAAGLFTLARARRSGNN